MGAGGGVAGGGGGEGDGEGGLGEAVVGEILFVSGEVGDGEAGFVFEELELVDDAGDGVGVGRPLHGGGEEPVFAVAGEGDGGWLGRGR